MSSEQQIDRISVLAKHVVRVPASIAVSDSVACLMPKTGMDLAEECVWVEVPSSYGLKTFTDEEQTA
jgi:hypothetical protein